MKKTNILFSILICILFAGFSIGLAKNPVDIYSTDPNFALVNERLGFEVNNLRSSFFNISEYYDLGNQSIYIKDDNPKYNWSRHVADYPWCSGSGTEEDPYVIEKIFIDGGPDYKIQTINVDQPPGYPPGSGAYWYNKSAINIHNSKAHFVIRDCVFNRTAPYPQQEVASIHVENSTNGLIFENVFNFNRLAIYLGGSLDRPEVSTTANFTIERNIIVDNWKDTGLGSRGIYLEGCIDVVVKQNFVENTYSGIRIAKSYGCSAQKNFVNSTLWGQDAALGLEFFKDSSCSALSNVLAGDWARNIFVVAPVNCTGLDIKNNTVVGALPEFAKALLPHISASSASFTFADSIGGTIANNMMYIPGYAPPLVPGYNLGLFLIALMSAISIIIIIMVLKRLKMQIHH